MEKRYGYVEINFGNNHDRLLPASISINVESISHCFPIMQVNIGFGVAEIMYQHKDNDNVWREDNFIFQLDFRFERCVYEHKISRENELRILKEKETTTIEILSDNSLKISNVNHDDKTKNKEEILRCTVADAIASQEEGMKILDEFRNKLNELVPIGEDVIDFVSRNSDYMCDFQKISCFTSKAKENMGLKKEKKLPDSK